MSNEKYAIELIQACCAEYRAGGSVKDLITKYQVPRSTLYSWFARYKDDKPQNISYKKSLSHLRAQHEKLLQIAEIRKIVKCTVSSPLKERLYELEKLQDQYSIRVLSEALEVDRGTLYNHLRRNKKQNTAFSKKRQQLKDMVLEIYTENRGLYGGDKILAIIRERGIDTSPQTVRALMRELGLRSLRYTSKKDYTALNRAYETKNILSQHFVFDEPNMAWVSDCTQFHLFNRTYHICAILDLYARRIVAYKVSQKASTRLVTDTFKTAYNERKPDDRLVFHSDQGCQYTSKAFRTLLRNLHITQSFSRKATPYDNSVMESFFSTLKQEELYRSHYVSEAEFKRCLKKYIDFYNADRPHRANKYRSPNQKERAFFDLNAPSV